MSMSIRAAGFFAEHLTDMLFDIKSKSTVAFILADLMQLFQLATKYVFFRSQVRKCIS